MKKLNMFLREPGETDDEDLADSYDQFLKNKWRKVNLVLMFT